MVPIPACFLVPTYTRAQKLTRTLTYHLTPYELTLAVDLDTFCCTDLYPVLQAVFTAQPRGFDMAANGHEELAWHPDHGVKLFWWGEQTRRLLLLWEEAQVELGIASSDQIALMHAVQKHPEANFRFSRLPTSMSCRIRPGVNESFAMAWSDRHFSQSLPIYGPLFIIHMDGIQPFYQQLCALANADGNRTRVITFKHDPLFPTPETVNKFYHVAANQAECDAQMSGHCYPDLHWATQPFAITHVDKSRYVF